MDKYLRAGGMLVAILLSCLTIQSCSATTAQTSKQDEVNSSVPGGPEDRAHTGPTAVMVEASQGIRANSGSSDSNTLRSCDVQPRSGGDGPEHICVTWSVLNKGSSESTKAESDCAALGGVIGGSCTPSGLVAGCSGVASGSQGDVTFTYWYYSGTLGAVTSGCLSPMSVVLPGDTATHPERTPSPSVAGAM